MSKEKLPKKVLEVLGNKKLEDMAIKIVYKNWRGEEGIRNILPIKIYYGSTKWHKEEQWLMTVYDLDKKAMRDYALKDFKGVP